jgi:hypothetical protein
VTWLEGSDQDVVAASKPGLLQPPSITLVHESGEVSLPEFAARHFGGYHGTLLIFRNVRQGRAIARALENEAPNTPTSVQPPPTDALTTVRLLPNYPNPFVGQTTVRFALPSAQTVVLEIYDALGRRLSTAIDDVLDAGWHEVTVDGAGWPSGLYFARLHARGVSVTRPMLLLRHDH